MSSKTDQQDSRISGVVRSFMTEKGFGFINGDDGRSYFVHIKNVEGGELVDGQTVVFEGRPGPKGYKALRVIPGAPRRLRVKPMSPQTDSYGQRTLLRVVSNHLYPRQWLG